MKVHGSRHHHVHQAPPVDTDAQVDSGADVAGPAQIAKSLFQNDSFESVQPGQVPGANGTPATSSADPVTQLIGALLKLVEMLKGLFSQNNTPPATTSPVDPTAGAGTVGGTTPGTSTAEAQFRELIAKDIKASRGTDATDADYNYWLPKLMGPNDSGFVTSGQMTATEYWHRRMLGWQAGGSDVAALGPYAGDGQEHGPVPSAESIVPGVPSSGLASGVGGAGNPDGLSLEMCRRLIAGDVRLARGSEATQQDYDYWLPKLMGPNDSGLVTSGQLTATEYWHRRMLGWQAGGADAAQFGPYAGTGEQHAEVPPYAQMLAN